MSKAEAFKWYDVKDGKRPSPFMGFGTVSAPVLVTSRPGVYAVAKWDMMLSVWVDLDPAFGEVTHYMFIDPAK